MKKLFTAMLAIALALSFGVAQAQQGPTPNQIQSKSVSFTIGSAAGVTLVVDSLYGTTPTTDYVSIDPSKPFRVFVTFDSIGGDLVDADSFAVDMYSTCETVTKASPSSQDVNVFFAAGLTRRGINADSCALFLPNGTWNGSAGVKSRRTVAGTYKDASCFLFYPMPGSVPMIPINGVTTGDTTGTIASNLYGAATAKALNSFWMRNPQLRRNAFSAPIDFCPNVFFRLRPIAGDVAWAAGLIGQVTVTVVQ